MEELLRNGYVTRQKHPSLDLWIYNYTNKCQYERYWNEITLKCRGLIMDSAGNHVNDPVPKFFNASEIEWKLPNEPYKVFEKYDGSCCLLYWWNDEPWVATRGSFNSYQSALANGLLHTKYKHTWDKLDRSITYTFELLHPENRIVCDYGDRKELVLISMRKDGKELPLVDIGFPVASEYQMDIETLKSTQEENREGFVLLFDSGFRVKVKFVDYVRLHAIITGVTNRSIWEYLRNGQSLDDLVNLVPDEFSRFVVDTANELIYAQDFLRFDCTLDFLLRPDGDRKAVAEFFKTRKHPGILFSMLDGKDVTTMLWDKVKPKTIIKPFSNEYKNQQGSGGLPVL